jgi:hypothetical protein
LKSALFSADSYCPQWPDPLEGEYKKRDDATLQVNPFFVPDRTADLSCAPLTLEASSISLGGGLNQEHLKVEDLVIEGTFLSVGDVNGVCPEVKEPEAVVADVEEEYVPPVIDPKDWRFSLTGSPFHMLLSYLEITGELKMGERNSVAVLAGLGALAGSDSTIGIGAQWRTSLKGDFSKNLHAGAEVQYLHVTVGNDVAGMAIVFPFLGAKKIWNNGFTIDGQLGVAMLSEVDWEPILGSNLGIGWSFGPPLNTDPPE